MPCLWLTSLLSCLLSVPAKRDAGSEICRSILGTCKQILHEALPILYSKSTFQLVCANRSASYAPWFYLDSQEAIMTGLNAQAQGSIKHVAATYRLSRMERLKILAKYWPWIEEELRISYENLQTITFSIHIGSRADVCLNVMRRQHASPAEHLHEYRHIPRYEEQSIVLSSFFGSPQSYLSFFTRDFVLFCNNMKEQVKGAELAITLHEEVVYPIAPGRYSNDRWKMRTITLYLDCDRNVTSEYPMVKFLAKSEPRTPRALAKEQGYVWDLETTYEDKRVDEGEDEYLESLI